MGNLRELPIPSFFEPSAFGTVRRVPYGGITEAARGYAKEHQIKPASEDEFRIGLLAIDVQLTFCGPGFELFVNGAVQDTQRLCEFIYRNAESIHRIHATMDTHTATQIFHEQFFINDRGEHPAPMAQISAEQVRNGTWKVNVEIAHTLGMEPETMQKQVLHYVHQLEKQGKFCLTVWPYHAMLGGIGHALVPGFEEACFFHNLIRSSQTDIEMKGQNPLTENYSMLRPEVLHGFDGEAIAEQNTELIEGLLAYDALIIAGEAKSHCVAWTVEDLLTEINARDPGLAQKVYLLEDCTSPVVVPGVVDYTPEANEAYQRFVAAGMHLVKSTDPIQSWLSK